ncbi:MAG: hypothetical protein HND48_00270 [Chloroflexi bacterium]|nr:hypothetical protein [Chloroflexota bacterium]
MTLVDMREELKGGNTTIFSAALTAALDETLAHQEQAILYLNRRGTSTYVFCRDCGYVARCPNCDQPLTYHEHGSQLRCHTCGHSAPNPRHCPNCASDRIRYFGAGTQNVEAEVLKRWPAARCHPLGQRCRQQARNARRSAAALPRSSSRYSGWYGDGHPKGWIFRWSRWPASSAPMSRSTCRISARRSTRFSLSRRPSGGQGAASSRGGPSCKRTCSATTPFSTPHAMTMPGSPRPARRTGSSWGIPPFRRMARIVFKHPNSGRARDAAQQAAHVPHRAHRRDGADRH